MLVMINHDVNKAN